MFTSLRLHLSSAPPAAIQRGLSPAPRWRAAVDATLELTHERVDDVPLLLGFLIKLKLPEILDRHYPAHPLHQGLSNGSLITAWIAYILSRADHRKSPVQAWAQELQHTLETLIGQTIRPVEFSDDRLTLVLKRLDLDPAWESLEDDLWHTHCDVYALPVERVRLDATTSCGFHTVTDDGLMQLGHSKDHRPDLAQFKLMAAVAEPTGFYLAGDLHPGNAADDPLYLPLYRRVRTTLGKAGLLYAGDCKMAALETRGEIAANQDFYLTRLPLTGTVAAQFAGWVEAAVVGDRATDLIAIHRGEGQEEELLGRGYEFERTQAATVGEAEHLDGAGAGHPLGECGGEPGGGPGPSAGAGRGGGAGPDAARGPGPGPVHLRLGVGTGRRGDLDRAGGDGAVDGDLGAAGDRAGALRGPRPWRPEPAQGDGAGGAVSDHLGGARRGGDRTPGGADGLAGAGDQCGGVAAVAGGLRAELSGGDVRGACVPPAEGPTAGDPPALRASRRPDPGPDAPPDVGVAGADAVRGAGAARSGSR